MAGRGRGLIQQMQQLNLRMGQARDTDTASDTASASASDSASQDVPKPRGRGQLLAQILNTFPSDRGDGEPSSSRSRPTPTPTPIETPVGPADPAPPQPQPQPLPAIGRGISGVATFARGRAQLLKQFGAAPLPTPSVAETDRSSVVSEVSFASDPTPHEPVVRTGTKGKTVPVFTNYVRLRCTKDAFIYEYHVTFVPPVDAKKLRIRLIHESKHVIGPTMQFDGAKLYLPIRLEKILTAIDLIHPYDKTPQQVVVKYVTKQNLTSCNHLFNVLFKRIMNILQLKLITRKYFNPKESMRIAQYKLQIWPGYVTSVAEYEGGLMLMCDAAHKVLRDCTAFDIIKDCCKRGGDWKKEAEKQLVSEVVMTRYNNRTYRVDEVNWVDNPRSTFSNHLGNEVTFVDYYKKQYQIEIQDDEQPMLIHREKPARGTTESRVLLLVPELSYLTGMSAKMMDDFQMMKSVATHTRLTPNQRQFAFKRFLENVHGNPEATKQLTDWGLELDTNMLKLEGRVLEPARLLLGNGKKHVVDERADWNNALCRGSKLFVPIDIKYWTIIFFNRDSLKANNFKQKATTVGPAMGMEISEPEMMQLTSDRNEAFVAAINKVVNCNPKLQIVVTICPTARDDRYAAIKKRCYLELGMANQVINVRTISRDDKLHSVTQKIVLQMNCKLGGELWGLHCPISDMMIVGMDVFHDASKRSQSVLGFVSSLNSTFTKWFSKTTFQGTHQELGDSLRSCMMAALKKYFSVNNNLPQRIVVFRDGVSDGQLKTVVEHEIQQIEGSFSISEHYEPKLSVIIVQKRINTRIFGTTGRDLMNPVPGTILDHTVTRYQYYDFFLVSQHVNQGTVTPTHYIVIKDGNEFAVDMMQKLAYMLTHMYFNWPGTVRVPAPCQYAHKLAQLTGQHLHREAEERLCDKLFFL